jgi:hypothetical protein
MADKRDDAKEDEEEEEDFHQRVFSAPGTDGKREDQRQSSLSTPLPGSTSRRRRGYFSTTRAGSCIMSEAWLGDMAFNYRTRARSFRKSHMKSLILILLITLGTLTFAQDQSITLGSIDFYGHAGLDTDRIRASRPEAPCASARAGARLTA